MHGRTLVSLAVLTAALMTLPAYAGELSETAFASPPREARPELFWDWMYDMVTREGITHDLEAMKRAGFAGALIMLVGEVDAKFNPAHNMPNPVKCLSPEFFAHWKFAAEEADRLGLTLISQCGPGWCHSGGPWITPEQAVQELCWSEAQVAGPATAQTTALPVPDPDFTRDIAIVAFPRKDGLRPEDVVELTERFRDGALTWDVPAGDWSVRRYAMRNAQAYNRVAPPEGRGLECDKLSKDAVKAMFDGMVGRYIQDSPQLAGKSILGMEADSWEVGNPEWSSELRREFQVRRGYDPVPWLVGFKGGPNVGGDLDKRFAYDLYLTQIDCFADNFFSYLTDMCRAHGMDFLTEPYYGPFDPVRCGGRTARPMGEVWASGDCMNSIRWAASAAHTYGRKMAGAETFTGRWCDGAWAIDPYALKRVGDLAFCNGLNKMMLHGTAMQPWGGKVKPGMPMGPWGTMFCPGQTWWEPGRAWIDYLSRCQYLLQQGQFVADILGLFPATDWKGTMPAGLHKLYNYDLCAEEMLMKLEYRDGRFVLPNGMSYRAMLLPATEGKMAPAVLRKVVALVEEGGTVVCCEKPTTSPSMQGYPACDDEVRALVERLWGACDGKSVLENRCGNGRLVWMQAWTERDDPESTYIARRRPPDAFYNRPAFTVDWSSDLVKLLRGMGVQPDVEIRTAGGRAQHFPGKPETTCGARAGEDAVAWIHRRAGDADIYFLASQVADTIQAELLFRIDNKIPELWNPETGRITKPAIWRSETGRAVLSMRFAPYESTFVVFRPGNAEPATAVMRDAYAWLGERFVSREGDAHVAYATEKGSYKISFGSGKGAEFQVDDLPAPLPLDGEWTVRFPEGLGAPPEAKMPLESWTTSRDLGVRYFSGTSAYVRDFDVAPEFVAPGLVHTLDLGEVKNLAEVIVNGKTAGVLWKEPFRADVTGLLQAGQNHLEIKVTNLWLNRLVGDELQPDDCEWEPPRYMNNDLAGQAIKRIPDWVWTGGPRPEPKRIAFTTWKFYTWSTPLLPSGLLGPVTLRPAKRVEIR